MANPMVEMATNDDPEATVETSVTELIAITGHKATAKILVHPQDQDISILE